VEEFWERFRLDPRQPANAAMRASDADRELVRAQLAEAYADGRITREEYDERLTATLGAVTLGDLPPIVADLVPSQSAATPAAVAVPSGPGDIARRAQDAWRRKVRDDVGSLVFISVLLWSIWFFAGHGFPWPVFPMVAVGVNALNTLLSRGEIVAKEAARLERKQRKQLERRERPERPAEPEDPDRPERPEDEA
jgi:type III secretory pathway component EscV